MRFRWKVCMLTCVVGSYLTVIATVSLLDLRTSVETNRRGEMKASRVSYRGAFISHRGRGRGAKLPWCKPLKFVDPPGPVTALVSFPGSGNTWLRYLFQQLTGLYTGSVYKDFALMKNGFPAESVSNGSVILVKTHEYGPQVRETYSRAILIIRDPFESILAEFNRQSGGHVGHAQPDKYNRDQGKYWASFVKNKVLVWTNTNLDWLKFKGPLHIVFYEDLKNDLPAVIRKLIEFLDLPIDQQSFDCMIKHKDGIYKRRKKNLSFNPYTKKLTKLLIVCKNIVNHAVREYLKGNDVQNSLNAMNMTILNSLGQNTTAYRTMDLSLAILR